MTFILANHPAKSISFLAQEFLDATVNKLGTDEEDVVRILREVHDTHSQAEFEQTVYSRLGAEDGTVFCANATQVGKCYPVIPILADEMSRPEFSRASGTYLLGKDLYLAAPPEYFLSGIKSSVDFSTTASKVGAVVVVGGLALLTYLNPPVGLGVTAAVATGIRYASTAAMAVNALELLYDLVMHDYEGLCGDSEDMGHWMAIGMLNEVAAPKIFRRFERDIMPLSPNTTANRSIFDAAVRRINANPNATRVVLSRQLGSNRTQLYLVDTPTQGRWIVDSPNNVIWKISHLTATDDTVSVQCVVDSTDLGKKILQVVQFADRGRGEASPAPPVSITAWEVPPAMRDQLLPQLPGK